MSKKFCTKRIAERAAVLPRQGRCRVTVVVLRGLGEGTPSRAEGHSDQQPANQNQEGCPGAHEGAVQEGFTRLKPPPERRLPSAARIVLLWHYYYTSRDELSPNHFPAHFSVSFKLCGCCWLRVPPHSTGTKAGQLGAPHTKPRKMLITYIRI